MHTQLHLPWCTHQIMKNACKLASSPGSTDLLELRQYLVWVLEREVLFDSFTFDPVENQGNFQLQKRQSNSSASILKEKGPLAWFAK